MELIKQLCLALWHQDYNILMNSSIIWIIYIILFIIIFLENSILPAAFLPGDSLLILVGVLVAKGTINYLLIIVVLTISASLGYWIGYIQGKWLGNNKIIKTWLSYLPDYYHNRAYYLFDRYGLIALIIGRFLAFVRTIIPIMAGIYYLSNNNRFQFFNWLSGFLWIFILINIGYFFAKSIIFKYYENQIMNILVLLPSILLCIGILGGVITFFKKK